LGSAFLELEKLPLSGEFSAESEAVFVKAAPTLLDPGVLEGPSFGVFLDIERSAGLISGVRGEVVAASGRDRGGRHGSIVRGGGPPDDGRTAPLGALLDFCIFINEAGVAGPCRTPLGCFDFATIAGEFDADADAGCLGGGMTTSRGSGEIESSGEAWCCGGARRAEAHDS
jgi:hypothetical protein